MKIITLIATVAAITDELATPEFKLCLIHDPNQMSATQLTTLQLLLLREIGTESMAMVTVPVSEDRDSAFAKLPDEAKTGAFPKLMLTINAAELRLMRNKRGVGHLAKAVPKLAEKLFSLIRKVARFILDKKDGVKDTLTSIEKAIPEPQNSGVAPESYAALGLQIEWVKTKVAGLVDSVKAVLIKRAEPTKFATRNAWKRRLMTYLGVVFQLNE